MAKRNRPVQLGPTQTRVERDARGQSLLRAETPLGAYPRYIRTAHRLVIDEGALDTEELLFDAGYIGEL